MRPEVSRVAVPVPRSRMPRRFAENVHRAAPVTVSLHDTRVTLQFFSRLRRARRMIPRAAAVVSLLLLTAARTTGAGAGAGAGCGGGGGGGPVPGGRSARG